MKLKLSLVIAVLALGLSAVVAVAAPSAHAAKGTTNGAPTQQFTATYNGTSYVGQFTVTSFQKVNGVIRAYGTFNGTNPLDATDTVSSTGYAVVTAANGHPLTSGATNLATAAANGTCGILSLTLGPLHLDLLGLVVDLNQINLNITAQQGPGNLLGNLLCSVAGLLDNTGGATGGLNGLLTGITNLLNQILAQL
jgi:hypothetical protein